MRYSVWKRSFAEQLKFDRQLPNSSYELEVPRRKCDHVVRSGLLHTGGHLPRI